MAKSVFKSDKYKRARGGYSRLLDISCSKCNTHLFYYQKDGPGLLKRTYLDRVYGSKKYSNLENESLKNVPQLVCPHCKKHIGMPFNYAKENRLAYRLFVGEIKKSLVDSNKVIF